MQHKGLSSASTSATTHSMWRNPPHGECFSLYVLKPAQLHALHQRGAHPPYSRMPLLPLIQVANPHTLKGAMIVAAPPHRQTGRSAHPRYSRMPLLPSM